MSDRDFGVLDVVEKVDLSRYLGRWFEVARLPAGFEKGCGDVTATYSLNADGSVAVLNECVRNGKVKRAKGKAKIVDKASGAKLKVTFFWPFYGDYWVIKLGEDYEYSVVGSPSRKYLWILSRTPRMDEARYAELVEFARGKGFPVEKLERTSQSQR